MSTLSRQSRQLGRIDPGTIVLWVLVALYAVGTSMTAIKQYTAFSSHGDLTVYQQVLWNSVNGRPFETTYNWSIHNFWSEVSGDERTTIPPNSSYFGIHLEPALILLWPFYWLAPRAETILALQSIALGLGAWPIYLLARERFNRPLLGLLAAVAYLLSPVLAGVNLLDFHAAAFLTPLVGFAFYYLETQKVRALLTCLLLCLLTTESASITISALGIYALVIKRRPVLGAAITLTSLFYFAIATQKIIPSFSLYGNYIFSGYFSRWGGTTTDVILTILSHPQDIIQVLSGREQLKYISDLFGPLAFLPVLAPDVLLIALPVLFANLIADSSAQRLIVGQYSAAIIPIIYLAEVIAIHRILTITRAIADRFSFTAKLASPLPRRLLAVSSSALFLTYSLVMNSVVSNFPLIRTFNYHSYIPPEGSDSFFQLAAMVPQEASVATVDSLSVHLANRRLLYLFPVYSHDVEYVLITQRDAIWPLTQGQHDAYIQELLASGQFREEAREGNYLLLGRNADLARDTGSASN